ncbi:hypothetical protein HZS_3915 [Henneguya salminicola]|nr:hypothetical protein HZS_3915 [Henneguya salminicola]
MLMGLTTLSLNFSGNYRITLICRFNLFILFEIKYTPLFFICAAARRVVNLSKFQPNFVFLKPKLLKIS